MPGCFLYRLDEATPIIWLLCFIPLLLACSGFLLGPVKLSQVFWSSQRDPTTLEPTYSIAQPDNLAIDEGVLHDHSRFSPTFYYSPSARGPSVATTKLIWRQPAAVATEVRGRKSAFHDLALGVPDQHFRGRVCHPASSPCSGICFPSCGFVPCVRRWRGRLYVNHHVPGHCVRSHVISKIEVLWVKL